MKQVKVKIETSVETMLGDKPVNEFLGDIADICHTSLNTQHQKMKSVRHSMRTKNMKITEMTWRIGYLFLKVLFVRYWIYWRIKKESRSDNQPAFLYLTLRKCTALSTDLISQCKYIYIILSLR